MPNERLEAELAKYFKPQQAQDRDRYLRMLLYGQWGVGKTILACQVGQRPMELVTEPSDDSLADWPELASRTDVVEYGGLNHLGLIRDAFKQNLYPNDTLIVDTVSELVESQLDTIRQYWHSPKNTRPTFKSSIAGNSSTLEVNGTDDYRLIRDVLRPIVMDLCLLPINLIFIAHERDITWSDEKKLNDDGTPLPPIRPDLPSQTLKLLAKRVSVVGRMTRDGDRRMLSFVSGGRQRIEVKSRIKALDNRQMSDKEFIETVNNWRAR